MRCSKATPAKAALLLLALFAGFSVEAYGQGNCAPAQAEAFLDVNNVRARILNNGALFWRGNPVVYEVPKGSGVNAIFTANFWVGGLVDDELRMAAARYASFQFWPGPLNEDGMLPNPDDCSGFDRIFKVSMRDLLDYGATGTATQDLVNWPWRLGAPVIDGDGDPNNYNLEGGDRPEVLGHQTLWWVMNDAGNAHLIPGVGTPPINLEVQATVFAARSAIPAIDNATLYRYKLIYRGQMPLEKAYVGFFVDPDLGNFGNDYIGSDSTLDLAYVYNGDNLDEGDGGYEENPPALGLSVLQGPLVKEDGIDNDGDGTTDEADERLGMTSFLLYSNSDACGFCDEPPNALVYYNYMQARWSDGQHVTLGGKGRDFSEVPANFMFSGDPVTGAFWTELNSDGNGTAIPPADRRFIMASGPFTMQPGETQEVFFGIMWGRGADHRASVGVLRQVTQAVQDAFEAGFDIVLPAAPAEAARLVSPADRATGQPTNPTLHWDSVTDADEYQIELATDDMFSMGTRRLAATTSFVVEELGPDSTYYWRVRGGSAGGVGPWSDAWRFSTSNTTLMGGVVLTFDDGAPAFVEVVGPGGVDPCGPQAGSTFGCDEVGGNNVWLSFNGSGEYILGTPTVGPEERLGRFVPNDFELRVTEQGSYGYHSFTTGNAVWTPVEVWDIGPTGPFNENDLADDLQMIVNLFSDSDSQEGECFFGYGELKLFHRSASDRIYAYYPTEGASYDDYAALIGPLVEDDPNGCPTDPATATAANLIDFDRGRPIQEVVFLDDTGGVKDIADLSGAVIRFYTTEDSLSPPGPSAPRNRAVSLPFTVPLWWSAPPGATSFHLQVSANADFTANIVDESALTASNFTVSNFPVAGSYYWRVRALKDTDALSDWSEVWAFTVGTATAVEDPDAGIPTTFQLDANYPNPFNPATTIRFGLPRASVAKVTIYNVLGQRVATLAEERFEAGWHTVQWNAQDAGSGVYFYRIEAGAFREIRTMLLLK